MSKKQTRSAHTTPSASNNKPFNNLNAGNGSVYLHLFLLIVTGIVLYANTFDASFHFDDDPNIVMNKVIRNLSVSAIWDYSHNRFLPFLSFAVNYHLGEYNVWGYHFVNLLIHLLASAVVYWLTILLFSSQALRQHPLAAHCKTIALGTALLFVAHPLATQSVTYVVQRMASMVALFYLLSVALYLKARMQETGLHQYLLFTAAALAALCAFHSKENAYTLPLVILFTEFTLLQKKEIHFSTRDYRFWAGLGLAAISVVIAIARFSTSIFKPLPPSLGTPYSISSQDYLLTQFSVIVKYIQLLLLPIGQNLDYDYPLSTGFFELRTFSCFLVLLSLLALAVWQYNRNRLLSFCIGWFFLTLSIESSIVPIADVIFEHRTYLPSFGFFLIVVSLLFQYTRKLGIKYALVPVLLMVLCYGIATIKRNEIWKDDFTLKQDIVQKSPGKPRPKVNLGMEYFQQQDYDQALAYFREAAALNNQYFDALNNMATCFLISEKWDSARIYFTRAIMADSTHSKAYYGRGVSLSRMQRWQEAIADFNQAIRMRNDYYEAYTKRATAYMSNNEWEKAIADYNRAIALNPTQARDFFDRGLCYGRLQQYEASLAEFSQSIALNSKDAEVYFNRAVTYANLKQFEQALKDFESTLALSPQNKTAAEYKRRMEEEIKRKN